MGGGPGNDMGCPRIWGGTLRVRDLEKEYGADTKFWVRYRASDGRQCAALMTLAEYRAFDEKRGTFAFAYERRAPRIEEIAIIERVLAAQRALKAKGLEGKVGDGK